MSRLVKMITGISAALALGMSAGQAGAATWIVTYTATSGMPSMANLTLDVADTLNAVGGFDVLAITGDVDGDTITGIITNPGQPFASYSADGLFIFDNVVWNGPLSISNPGLFFAGASGDEYNLFSNGPSTFELYRARSGVGYLANSTGSLAAGPQISQSGSGGVPEPATWSMLILGFGAVGSALRRRRVA